MTIKKSEHRVFAQKEQVFKKGNRLTECVGLPAREDGSENEG